MLRFARVLLTILSAVLFDAALSAPRAEVRCASGKTCPDNYVCLEQGKCGKTATGDEATRSTPCPPGTSSIASGCMPDGYTACPEGGSCAAGWQCAGGGRCNPIIDDAPLSTFPDGTTCAGHGMWKDAEGVCFHESMRTTCAGGGNLGCFWPQQCAEGQLCSTVIDIIAQSACMVDHSTTKTPCAEAPGEDCACLSLENPCPYSVTVQVVLSHVSEPLQSTVVGPGGKERICATLNSGQTVQFVGFKPENPQKGQQRAMP